MTCAAWWSVAAGVGALFAWDVVDRLMHPRPRLPELSGVRDGPIALAPKGGFQRTKRKHDGRRG